MFKCNCDCIQQPGSGSRDGCYSPCTHEHTAGFMKRFAERPSRHFVAQLECSHTHHARLKPVQRVSDAPKFYRAGFICIQ